MSLDRNKIKLLKSIIESKDFYPFLCEYSSNDIEIVVDNLAKIINYLLSADNIPNDLEELFNNAVNYHQEGKYLIYSTNSYLENYIRLKGLNPDHRHKTYNELMLLDRQISFLDFHRGFYLPLYGTIKDAIEAGFSNPKTLYESILKQPEQNKRPVIVGETETAYYSSILQRRLQNVPNSFSKTGANIARKVLNEIIGKDVTLYFLPTDRELGHEELYEKVSPFALRSISIPSRYTLLMICAKNKRLKEGTKISLDNGEVLKESAPEKKKKYSSLYYPTYEEIPITEDFIYDNDELTGEAIYDIDDLYGKFNSNGSREKLSDTYLSQRLDFIKNSHDISAIKRDNKYRIVNGRHRLVYLKYYYLSNYKQCKTPLELESLKKMVTAPICVNKTIEDEETQRVLIYLEQINPSIKFYKTNIENDNCDLIIVNRENAYHIKSKKELIKLASYLGNRKDNNEFFIGHNTNIENAPYEIIINKLITILKGDFFKMDLIGIVRYLQNNSLTIGNKEINLSTINYHLLYYSYITAIHEIQLSRIRKQPIQIIASAEAKINAIEATISNRERKK